MPTPEGSGETARIAEIRELLMKLAEAAHRGGYCDADESKFTDEAAAEMWAMSESIHRRVESTLQDLLSRLSASPADVGPTIGKACEACKPEYGDCLNAGCFAPQRIRDLEEENRALRDNNAAVKEMFDASRQAADIGPQAQGITAPLQEVEDSPSVIALRRIFALDFKKTEVGGDDFYSGPDRFVHAWMIANEYFAAVKASGTVSQAQEKAKQP